MNIGFTPVNQVRLTNVAYVRLQKKGKRFEIACYRNKVLNWRNKIETDIEEVLQIDTVFTNVSKGMLASSKDLIDVFGTADQKVVCKEILDKGELQVSEQERGALYESVFRDVASIVADKTVNPETGRPYTISMIQNAMKQIQYSVSVSKNSKSQALDVIRKLRDIMPIVRANMLLRVVCTTLTELKAIKAELIPLGAVIVADGSSTSMTDSTVDEESTQSSQSSSSQQNTLSLDLRVDPEAFRRVEEIVLEKTSGAGRVEVIQLRIANSYSTTAAVAVGSQPVTNNQQGNDCEVNETLSTAHIDSTTKPCTLSKSAQRKELKSRQRGNLVEQHILGSVDATSSSVLREVLAEVTDSGDEGEEMAIGMVRKGKEKKKNKGRGTAKVAPTQSRQLLLSTLTESHSDGANDFSEDDSEGEHDLHLAMAISASMSVPSTTTTATAMPAIADTSAAHTRKGKKGRRMEKEELKERETKAAALRERVLLQQQQQQQTNAGIAESGETQVTKPAGTTTSSNTAQSCNTCGGSFSDIKEYRNHFRSEWHRHNLSRKLKGLPLVSSEEAFLALSLDELDL